MLRNVTMNLAQDEMVMLSSKLEQRPGAQEAMHGAARLPCWCRVNDGGDGGPMVNDWTITMVDTIDTIIIVVIVATYAYQSLFYYS